MGNLWKKLIRKVFKSSSYRVNNFSKIFSFKVKTIDEIQSSNRNTIYKYFLDDFDFQASKNIRLHRYYFKKIKEVLVKMHFTECGITCFQPTNQKIS